MFDKLKTKLSHLPVNDIVRDVAIQFFVGNTPIVTSEVASGKTLLIPTYCTTEMDEPIYVLEPTRFLAMNAAETMIDLLDGDPDDLIGYLNSSRSGEESKIHPTNKIIFTTVGYALSAGILSQKSAFIIDEAHETSIDLSLVKSIIHMRRRAGEEIRLAILSATLDLENEMEFWNEWNPSNFKTSGSSFPVTHIHHPNSSLGESVLYLIEEEGKTGILVFVSGKEEIDNALVDVIDTLQKSGISLGLDFEITYIHGGSSSEERRRAVEKPNRPIKILVGTNVLESGISLPWVNAGVSSGETKVLHVNGNIHNLQRENLPAWRINQQEGRVGRFRPGTFILADKIPIENRPLMAKPDIVRLPLTELVMHCAKIPNIIINNLQFTKKEQPPVGKIQKAITDLELYGLIKHSDDGFVELTEDGKLIGNLPLSYKAAAAYCEACHIGEVEVLLPLIAMIDVGDLRHDRREVLGGITYEESDLVHQVSSIAQMHELKRNSDFSFKEIAESHNLSLKKYREYTNLLTLLENKIGKKSNYIPYLLTDQGNRNWINQITKQVVFRSMAVSRYKYSIHHRAVVFDYIGTARFSNTSVCLSAPISDILFATGNLRTITPKKQYPFTVLESVTIFKREDVSFLLQRFGKKLVDPDDIYEDLIQKSVTELSSVKRGNNKPNILVPMEKVKKGPTEGSFGALLQAALDTKK